MKTILALAAILPLSLIASGAQAAPAEISTQSAMAALEGYGDDSASEAPYLQCVPYARQVSGIQIYGDAWTWWDQADGKYERGLRPKVGAVMSFRPYGNMRLGHVAAVSRVIDSRTVLVRHANWSLIGGRRGQIEDNVRAIDVSPGNDWSEVRVWFAPLGDLGTTRWPLNGFIYPKKAGPGSPSLAPRTVFAAASAPARPAAARTALTPVRMASTAPAGPSRIGPDFLRGIRSEVPVARQPARQYASAAPAPRRSVTPAVQAPQRTLLAAPAARKPAAPARTMAPARGDDPIGRIIAARSK